MPPWRDRLVARRLSCRAGESRAPTEAATSPDAHAAAVHDHTFGQDAKRPGEGRTLLVIGITAAMMVVEIAAGIVFGSMALLADGVHMASHAAALSVTFVAYVVARRYAADPRFSFGTGKVNALGGFASAVLLVAFALFMAVESVVRLLNPVPIRFDQAILVAFAGLAVNGASAWILRHEDEHEHGHSPHDDPHEHPHGHTNHADHNLRAAYLHVLADALTSVLAIFALGAGRWLGAVWMDPVMGMVGATLVTRWSVGLLRATGGVLLDRQAPATVRETIRRAIEDGTGDVVVDLHVWTVGPGIRACALAVESAEAATSEEIRARLPRGLGIVHTTVEVQAKP